jgi:hypothetical protein
MTEHYKHFSEDERWIQINYTKLMENSHSEYTRLNTQLCNIVPSLESIDMTDQFYFTEQYIISKGKYMNLDEKEGAQQVIKYLNAKQQ